MDHNLTSGSFSNPFFHLINNISLFEMFNFHHYPSLFTSKIPKMVNSVSNGYNSAVEPKHIKISLLITSRVLLEKIGGIWTFEDTSLIHCILLTNNPCVKPA